jgi:hypothetical protein
MQAVGRERYLTAAEIGNFVYCFVPMSARASTAFSERYAVVLLRVARGRASLCLPKVGFTHTARLRPRGRRHAKSSMPSDAHNPA